MLAGTAVLQLEGGKTSSSIVLSAQLLSILEGRDAPCFQLPPHLHMSDDARTRERLTA